MTQLHSILPPPAISSRLDVSSVSSWYMAVMGSVDMIHAYVAS